MAKIKEKLKDGYGVSRLMYMVEALFEYFISILTTGVYLAKVTTTIGISDSMTAILSSIGSLSGVFQIISIYLAHKTPVKRWVVPMQLITTLMFASLYMIPLIKLDINVSLIFFIIMVSANALQSIASPIKVNWFMSLVPSHERGMYRSKLTIMSVVGGTLFSLFASAVIAYFEEHGSENSVFIVLTVMTFILVILHIIPLLVAKEKYEVRDRSESPLKSVVSLFKNRNYRTLVVIFTLYSISSGITTPFLNTYQLNELGFSLSFIAAINVIVNVVWILLLVIFGVVSYKHSHNSIMTLGYISSILAYVFVVISTPENGAVTFTLYKIILLIYNASNSVSHTNMIFEMTPPEDRTSAVAIATICSGVCSFLSTLAVTPLVNYIQKNGFSIFGINVYAQQLLAAISALIVVAVAILLITVGKKKDGELDFSEY